MMHRTKRSKRGASHVSTLRVFRVFHLASGLEVATLQIVGDCSAACDVAAFRSGSRFTADQLFADLYWDRGAGIARGGE